MIEKSQVKMYEDILHSKVSLTVDCMRFVLALKPIHGDDAKQPLSLAN